MSNNSISLVGLDFAQIKSNLISYLKRSDSPFKDVDFEGSNINNLVDVLSYNTYINSFYLNMVASEMFMDTAQLRDSVLSHAKELNYVPRSFRSASAKVAFTVTPSTPLDSLIIPKGTSFTTRVGSSNYTFTVNEATTINANTDGDFYANLTIYEGSFSTDSFVYQSSNTTQRFVLTNPTIDTSSLTVTVTENNGANVYTYTRASTFLGQSANSKIYFLQAAENNQYELIFGDDIIGRRPKNGAVVSATYRSCSGELPNGARQFDIDGAISGQTDISPITTVTAATGGAISETIESIKYNAPRHYQNQERAVTASDYESLLRINFLNINDISAYGGEDLDPPVYGKVYIAVDTVDSDGVADGDKLKFYEFIKTRTPVSIDPVFVDPEFLYLEARCVARYNSNITTATPNDIGTLVKGVISQYNLDSLNGFKKTLRYSNLVGLINNAHNSLISHDLDIVPFKKIIPTTGTNFNTVLDFGFELSTYYTISHDDVVRTYIPAVRSTNMIKDNKTVYIKDDTAGNLGLYTVEVGTDAETLLSNVGTVNYLTGSVSIVNLNINDYIPASGSHVHIYATPKIKDISSTKNQIITIADGDIEVVVEAVKL